MKDVPSVGFVVAGWVMIAASRRGSSGPDAAGLAAVPAPPTFTFAAPYWSAFRADEQPADPTGGQNPMFKVMGELHAKGGLVLHGEQEFVYHRPIVEGDVLTSAGRISDIYEKESKGSIMTFIVMETEWTDEAGAPVVTERFNLIHRRKA
jgi:hydroxyacyl-ACP dehydratase HTD2-like protein with hotdog domain